MPLLPDIALPSREKLVELAERRTKRVVPSDIFVARKACFEAKIHGITSAMHARSWLFEELPLEQHGWDYARTRIRHIGNSPDGMIFLVQRT